MALNLQSTNEEKILITVIPLTANRKPAKLDGPVIVTVTSGESTVEMVSDTSFFVVSSDNPGASTYLVEGISGANVLQDTIDYNVIAAPAASFDLTADAPVLK